MPKSNLILTGDYEHTCAFLQELKFDISLETGETQNVETKIPDARGSRRSCLPPMLLRLQAVASSTVLHM